MFQQESPREQVYLVIERSLEQEREKLLKIRKQIEKCETNFSAFLIQLQRPPE